jgi:hypothetical protein
MTQTLRECVHFLVQVSYYCSANTPLLSAHILNSRISAGEPYSVIFIELIKVLIHAFTVIFLTGAMHFFYYSRQMSLLFLTFKMC